MASISIVIPAFNEEKSIAKTISGIKSSIQPLGSKNKIDIIIVNDGSKDNTSGILQKIKGITLLENSVNLGYGASLKLAIKKSNADYIIIVDADGTYPAESIRDLAAKLKDNDMVVGARTGKYVSIPLFRRPAKWFLKHFAEYLAKTEIPDLNSGLRIFKREIAMKYINLFPDGFSFTTTLTMICLTNGYAVHYIPINYYERKGKSTISPVKDFIAFVSLICRLTIFFKPLNVFIPISLVILIAGILKLIKDFMLTGAFGLGGGMAVLAAIQIAFLGMLADLIIKNRQL